MSVPPVEPEDEQTLAYYEAVPYVLVLESSSEMASGFAAPPIRSCRVASPRRPAALEAIEKLEDGGGVSCVTVERGAPIPVPRPPLSSGRRA